MNAAGHQLLAGAVLAVYEDAAVARRGLGNLRPEALDRRALAHHDPAVLDLLLESPVLRFEALAAESVPHHEQRLFERKGFLDEVLRAQTHRLDRGLDAAVAGDHHHGQLGIERAHPRERLEPVDRGQPDVEQQQVEAPRLQRRQACFAALDGVDEIALVRQDSRERGPDARFVVDDQDRFAHHHLAPMPAAPRRSVRRAEGSPRPG
jgi:hypothetical protein